MTSHERISARISAIAPSATLAVDARAKELKAAGRPVIGFGAGEPDFPTPAFIVDAARAALDDPANFRYTPAAGLPQLRRAIAEKTARDSGWEVEPSQVVVTNGGKQAVYNTFATLLNPGDEVIVFSPYWVSYEEMVKLADGVTVPLLGALENDYKVTAAQLEAAITPRTKLIMYSSPCNPTGAVFSKEELGEIAAVLAKHPRIWAVADEIYEYINFVGEHYSLARFPEVAERVVTVNGFSKGYAMTGWRIGYLAARADVAAACDKLQSQFTSATCSITQRAGLAALRGGRASADEMVAAYRRRRDLVLDIVRDIPGLITPTPEGAFYIFPDVSAFLGRRTAEGQVITNVAELALYLLQDAHVAAVPGDAFGAPNCMRFSTASADEKLVEAFRRIKVSLAKLMVN